MIPGSKASKAIRGYQFGGKIPFDPNIINIKRRYES